MALRRKPSGLGLSKGCLSYARISEARGISLVLENADALRERGVNGGRGNDGGRFRSDEIQYALTWGRILYPLESRILSTVFSFQSNISNRIFHLR